MPRPRIRRPLPNGIKPDALPAYVYFDPTGRGRWLYRHYDPTTQKQTARRIAGADATLRQIWDAYEAITRAPPVNTLAGLIRKFEDSPAFSDLAPRTQKDYSRIATVICAATTKDGVTLSTSALASWTPGAVRAYTDRRAAHSRSTANAELRYLRRIFSWAYERDLMPTNPARGVKSIKETPRQRYVTDGEYTAFLAFAGARYPYLVPAAELAYLCRLRLSEVLDMKRVDIREDGLFAARRKGSKDALTGWTPRLRKAIEIALALHGAIAGLFVIASSTRRRMLESTLQTAWQRAMIDWALLGNDRFTFHDLKRKGVSDAEGDKLAASGHRSAAMLRVYDVLPSKAPATR